MGFIRTDYKIDSIGVVLPNAYAQIKYISIDLDGMANVVFVIQKDRDSIATKEPIDTISYRCKIDKDLPVYEQIYIKAKKEIFSDWENNIVE